jgi:CDP-diacylglycerol---glycerol-3-phosphate 3-phosphatidyltransferase
MAATVRTRFWNVPNSLTMGRLALAVVVFSLIAYGYYWLALVLFGVAVLTDFLDGYLARLLNQATAIGRQLDPLVDKIIVCGGLVYLLTIPGTGLAAWMVTAIIIRELLIQGLRSVLEGRGEAFGAKWSGKVKTTFQCLAIAAILLALATHPPSSWLLARDLLIWAAVALTIYSGLAYIIGAWSRLEAPAPASSAS